MQFGERVFRDAFGAVVIQSRLGPPQGRRGLELEMWRGIEVGLPGWDRSHSQGQGTGHESPFAIRYAPAEVNREIQARGIERFLRKLLERKPPDVDLWLTTTTSTHLGTLRLREIQYRVDAVKAGAASRLFEARIEIENKRISPRVTVQAEPFGAAPWLDDLDETS